MARKTISIHKSSNKYTRSQRIFGVMFGLVLVVIGVWSIINYSPTLILELLVMAALSLGTLMMGGWGLGQRKWGWFLVILVLGLPVLYRLQMLNMVTAAIWLLILGLTALIN